MYPLAHNAALAKLSIELQFSHVIFEIYITHIIIAN